VGLERVKLVRLIGNGLINSLTKTEKTATASEGFVHLRVFAGKVKRLPLVFMKSGNLTIQRS